MELKTKLSEIKNANWYYCQINILGEKISDV